VFWFEALADVVESHLVTADVAKFPDSLRAHSDQLAGRSMIVAKTDPFPVECVVRGYLAGSGFKDYTRTGAVCGIALPKGLRESDRLDPPIFTPATKADEGHDENISFERMCEILDAELSARLRDVSLAIYERARDRAGERGLVLADTKFEFGRRDGRLVWIDEALTPDSSRFWPADGYAPGRSQPSFDKQYVRDYLESLGWDKISAPPELPEDVVARTRDKYREAYQRITGRELFAEAQP
jgi:phosphoribosylaminoimidazole-succinocarboxamide synthase